MTINTPLNADVELTSSLAPNRDHVKIPLNNQDATQLAIDLANYCKVESGQPDVNGRTVEEIIGQRVRDRLEPVLNAAVEQHDQKATLLVFLYFSALAIGFTLGILI